MPHGRENFRIAVFSEQIYEAPLHYHDEYAIFYIHAGKMKFGIGDDDYTARAGDIFFIERNTPYYALRTNDNDAFHYYSIVFHADLLGGKDDPCRGMLEECRVNRFLSLNDELLVLIPKMHEWDLLKPFGNELLIKTALFELLSYIFNTYQYIRLSAMGVPPSAKASMAVETVKKYIKEHYSENISLETLVSVVSYSKSHFLRIFKAQTGMHITDYINKFRVEKACVDLIYTQKTITETALSNGFNTVQYFTRCFHKIMGCTPSVYRRFSHMHINVYKK